MTPTTLTRIATATATAVLPAESLSRARGFYHDTLGFEVTDMPEDRQFLMHAGHGTSVLVYERARTTAQHTAAMFVVDDIHATMRELREHGITFNDYDMPGFKTVDGVCDMPSGLSAWFTDPEGNTIAITQMK